MVVHDFLQRELGRVPTHSEIAEEIGFKEESITKVLKKQINTVIEKSDLQPIQDRVKALCSLQFWSTTVPIL